MDSHSLNAVQELLNGLIMRLLMAIISLLKVSLVSVFFFFLVWGLPLCHSCGLATLRERAMLLNL